MARRAYLALLEMPEEQLEAAVNAYGCWERQNELRALCRKDAFSVPLHVGGRGGGCPRLWLFRLGVTVGTSR